MSTARQLHSLSALPVPATQGSLWRRIVCAARALKAVWKRVPVAASSEMGAEVRVARLPVVAKLPAISIAGRHARPMRKALARMVPPTTIKPAVFAARRPGVQGRWKSSDRVML